MASSRLQCCSIIRYMAQITPVRSAPCQQCTRNGPSFFLRKIASTFATSLSLMSQLSIFTRRRRRFVPLASFFVVVIIPQADHSPHAASLQRAKSFCSRLGAPVELAGDL